MDEARVLLEARGVTRIFGALTAVSNVSIALRVGEVHALIGTNGAGKSTLVDVISGVMRPTLGTVELAGCDITAWSEQRRAKAGVGRTFQRTSIFSELTVRENCRLMAQATDPPSWKWWTSAASDVRGQVIAGDVLREAGLAGHEASLARVLSHGQKRQLEIAMCLATGPQVLLLDEPLAGMGEAESGRMIALLSKLKRGRAILLIEHDMEAVFRIADRITVMVDGAAIATGHPSAIRNDPRVQHAYLGELHAT